MAFFADPVAERLNNALGKDMGWLHELRGPHGEWSRGGGGGATSGAYHYSQTRRERKETEREVARMVSEGARARREAEDRSGLPSPSRARRAGTDDDGFSPEVRAAFTPSERAMARAADAASFQRELDARAPRPAPFGYYEE